MSFEEEFDSIIRRKSEELNYPFDEKNWNKASALLDAERAAVVTPKSAKRFLVPALVAGVILILGVALYVGTLLSDANATGHKVAVTNAPVNSQQQQADNATGNTIAVEPQGKATAAPNTALNSKDIATTSEDAEKKDPASTSSSVASEKTSSSSANRANNKVRTTTQQDVTTKTSAFSTTRDRNSSSNTFAQKATPSQSSTDPATTNASFADYKTNALVNRSSHLPGNTDITKASIAGKSKNTDADTTPAGVNNSSIQPPVNENASNETQQIPVEQLPLMLVSTPPQEEQEITETPLNYLKRYDDDYFKASKKHKTHFLNVELGGTYLLGWNTDAGKDGKGLDWFGGFNYGLYLSNKFSISAGLQAYNIKNITQAFYTNKKVEYDFGSIVSNTVITSNNLYYVAVPVKISYLLNKTSQLTIGANLGYLVDSKNTMDTYQVLDNVKMHDKQVKNSGIYQNANSMNVMFGLAYKVDVMPRLSLNTEFVYGISDIFKNTRTIKNNEQTVGLRLSLQYTLFDK